MSPRKSLRICVGASAGGHMNQLLRLLDVADSWPHPPNVYLTTSAVHVEKLRKRGGRVYNLGETNRYKPFRALLVVARSLWVALRERPHVVISTGSFPIAIACLCCKLVGAKVVWIDSIANIEKLSMSGSLMRRFANLFLTQWPELARDDPKVEYVGEIL